MTKFEYFANEIDINGRNIGNNHPPYIVAELSGNHQGSLEQALNMISAASRCGVDAIKIQTYTADTITINHNSHEFMISDGIWSGRNLYQLYQQAHTPWEWHKILFEHAKNLNITLFSSPFDPTAVELLESLNCPAYKIASFEVNDFELIRCVAATGKPIIMSTGLATKEEISDAVNIIKQVGNQQLILLHCVSGYPTPVEDTNLSTINDLQQSFNSLVGLSDHTLTTSTSIAAVALGASFIEKHFVENRSLNAVDSAFSLEPQEFKKLVSQCQETHLALGKINYSPTNSEGSGRDFRRSLYVCKSIGKGEIFTTVHVKSIRPAFGLHTRYLEQVLGKKATQDIEYGTPLQLSHFKWEAG